MKWRHGFQGATAASGPDDRWFGLDYASDASGRLIRTSVADSRILGALPVAGANGPANGLNQVAQVAGRAAPLSWTDSGNRTTDGRGWAFTHDGFNRLAKAVNSATGVTMATAYDHANLRVTRNPTQEEAGTLRETDVIAEEIVLPKRERYDNGQRIECEEFVECN